MINRNSHELTHELQWVSTKKILFSTVSFIVILSYFTSAAFAQKPAFKPEMDALVVVSVCPDYKGATNNFNPTPLRFQLIEN